MVLDGKIDYRGMITPTFVFGIRGVDRGEVDAICVQISSWERIPNITHFLCSESSKMRL